MMVISLTQRFFLCTETGSESVDIRDEKGMFGLVAAALRSWNFRAVFASKRKRCAPVHRFLRAVRRWRRSTTTSSAKGQ